VFLHLASPVEIKKTGAESEITSSSTAPAANNRQDQSAASSGSRGASRSASSALTNTTRKSDRAQQRQGQRRDKSEKKGAQGEDGGADPNAPVILCLVVQNYRDHMDMNDLQVTVTLQTDIMTADQFQKVKPVMLVRDSVPAGQASAIALTQLWPSLAPFWSKHTQSTLSSASKPSNSASSSASAPSDAEHAITAQELLALAKSMSLTIPQLAQAREIWLHCKVTTTAQSQWLPENHVVLETTLTHDFLNECLLAFVKAAMKQPPPASIAIAAKKKEDKKDKTEVKLTHEVISVGLPLFDLMGLDNVAIRRDPTIVKHSVPEDSSDDDKKFSYFYTYNGNREVIKVTWPQMGAFALIGVVCGRILYWVDAGKQVVINSPVDVCLSRAPTNNDLGGMWGLSYADQWKCSGLQHLKRAHNSKKHSSWWWRSVFGEKKHSVGKEPDAIDTCMVVSSDTDANKDATVKAEDVDAESDSNNADLIKVTADSHLLYGVSWVLEPQPSSAEEADAIKYPTEIIVAVVYEFYPVEGCIDVTQHVSVPSSAPPLGRVGLRFAVPKQLQHAEYLGRGPHEAYPDRKDCAYIGYFESSVRDLHTPYVVPQECGTRLGPRYALQFSMCELYTSRFVLSRCVLRRWVSLRQGPSQGRGLMMIPNPLSEPLIGQGVDKSMNASEGKDVDQDEDGDEVIIVPRDVDGYGWSASNYSLEQLAACNHQYELEESSSAGGGGSTNDTGNVFVHIDSAIMGVGGYDSWTPNVDFEHLVIPSANSSVGSSTTAVLLVPLKRGQSSTQVYGDYNCGVYKSFGGYGDD
jgi:hypothetical protein